MIYSQTYRAGLIAAGISIAWTIIAYLVGIDLFTNWWMGIIMFIVIITYLIISLKNIKTQLGGYISFKDAFLNFLVMAVINIVISQTIYYLLIHVIDPDFGIAVMDVTIEKSIAMMESFGAPEAAIEEALANMEVEMEKQSTLFGALMNMLKGIGFMAVVGLIVAAIMKKNPPVFDNIETVD
jgi:hypothetical protein